MNVIKTKIDGLVIIEPKLFVDERGYFFESFNQRDFTSAVGNVTFVQDNESKSSYGVIRGLHFQKPPFAQSKLVRCVKGAVLDVAVDIRKESPTYGQYVECLLCAHDEEGSRIAKEYAGHTFNCQLSTFNCQLGQQLYIPKGFAHGFVVLSQQAVFQYKCDEFYHPEAEGAIAWNDPTINIDWQISAEDIILSAKDKSHPMLHDITSPFKDNNKIIQ